MDETTSPRPKTPWHVWVVGVVSLLWNAVGAFDFLMTQMRNADYLKALTAEQKEYIFGFPLWIVIIWGVATWGSVLGSALLLARRRLAVHLFFVSFISMLVTMVYNYVLTDGQRIMGGGAGALIFSTVIGVISLALLIYSRAIARRGLLR
ncbi:MAG: hypothetical protein ABIZ04_19420 [Opitutus sp.]